MLIFIGPIPPPEGGFSVVTGLVLNRLRLAASALFIINRSYRYNISGLFYYFISSLRSILCVIRGNRPTIIYLAASGGSGLWLDLLLVCFLRPFSVSLYVHHHSYHYIYNKSLPLTFLYSVFPGAIDIVLCDRMGIDLLSSYRPSVSSSSPACGLSLGCALTRVVSNSGWLSVSSSVSTPFDSDHTCCGLNVFPPVLRIGFISRPILEKGFTLVLDLYLRLFRNGYPSTLVLGGSPDEDFQTYLSSIEPSILSGIVFEGVIPRSNISYLYSTLHFLLLPTMYSNEVEPMVILEALSLGVPVLTIRRGCIDSIIPNTLPLANSACDFVDMAYDFIVSTFFMSNSEYSALRISSLNHFLSLCEEHQSSSALLVDELVRFS